MNIILNGEEIGGGSIRIHVSDFRKKSWRFRIYKDKVKILSFPLNALRFGTPPFLGEAYGLDSCNEHTKTDNIRDEIAFPKIQACMTSY
jgi:aspartyl-tRNA synthetase